MPKYFKTKKRYLTEDEKRERAETFNEFEAFFPIDVDEFIKQDIFDETIVLKCLNCDFEEEVEYEFIAETWFESEDEPYPISYCASCNKPKVVPLDVYNMKRTK